MAILILKDSALGPYVEYDEAADVMLATYGRKDEPPPSLWKPCPGEPDLEIGYFIKNQKVCVDRWCDEWEEQEVEHFTWLRLKNAKAHGHWKNDKALLLAEIIGLGFGLVNTMRHGQLALLGENWWLIREKT